MKLNKILVTAVAGALLGTMAQAQVNVVITGSTAFRAITFSRVQSLFDSHFSVYGDTNNGPGTYYGTVSNAIPSLHNTPVTICLSFSGSGAGMAAVDAQTPVPVVNTAGQNVNMVPNIAMSDVWPEAAQPSLNSSDFTDAIVGVMPFVWVHNNSADLAGVTNITREQAQLLMVASGVITNGGQAIFGMPCSYLGSTSTNPIYLMARDSGSGTRISIQSDIGYTGTDPLLFGWDAANQHLIPSTGYSSTGTLRTSIVQNSSADIISYLGYSDAALIAGTGAGTATTMSYEGVPFSIANVQSGAYPVWSYEHLLNAANGLSAQQQLVHDALAAAITSPSFQTNSVLTLYSASFVDQANMKVSRGADGGPITSLKF